MTSSDSDRMTVEFEATVGDAVESMRRTLARSPTARQARWRSCLMVAVLGWALTYFGSSEEVPNRFVGVVVAASAGAAFTYFADRWLTARRTRAFAREVIGPRESFPVRITVGPEGVFTQSVGPDALSRWENVTSVEVRDGGVDIWAGPLALVMVLPRAFRSDAERERFVGLVERYWNRKAARVGAGGQS